MAGDLFHSPYRAYQEQRAMQERALREKNAREDYNQGLVSRYARNAEDIAKWEAEGRNPSPVTQYMGKSGGDFTPFKDNLPSSRGVNFFDKSRFFKSDADGNAIPMSEEEIARSRMAQDKVEQEVANGAQGRWFDFMKNPQLTDYEKQYLRNQQISRELALASALTKPVFHPDADVSPAFVQLAGQDAGLAQGAMGQFTERQRLASDSYNNAVNLSTKMMGQSMQAQILAEQNMAKAMEAKNNANIYREQAKKLYGELDDDLKNAVGTPKFAEVVLSKKNEKQQNLAREYDAIIRFAEAQENAAQKYSEYANAQVGKSRAYTRGAEGVNEDWELGLEFGQPMAITPVERTQSSFAGQGQIGSSNAGVFDPNMQMRGDGVAPQGVSPSAPTSDTPSPVSGSMGYGTGASAGAGTTAPSVAKKPSARPAVGAGTGKKGKTGDIDEKWNALKSKDVKIRSYGSAGGRVNTDVLGLAEADHKKWVAEVSVLKGDIANAVKQNPKGNIPKYFSTILEMNSRPDVGLEIDGANVPKHRSILGYKEISGGNANEQNIYRLYLDGISNGVEFTQKQIDQLTKLLQYQIQADNLFGKKAPILSNNGLKLNKKVVMENGSHKTNKNGEKLYTIDKDNSFI